MLEHFTKIAATLNRPFTDDPTYVAGRPVASATTTSVQVVVPQPVTGKDLLMIPEGERTYTLMKTWCSTDLEPGDILGMLGGSFKVVTSQPWVDPETSEKWSRVVVRKVVHGQH
jgi:hypothetical protein